MDAGDYVIEDIDLILVMSVNPGFGNQSFIATQYDKIRALRSKIDTSGRDIDLAVDGGINAETAAKAVGRTRDHYDIPYRDSTGTWDVVIVRKSLAGTFTAEVLVGPREGAVAELVEGIRMSMT